jgi:hypothetical protein
MVSSPCARQYDGGLGVRLHGLDVSPQEVEQRRKVQLCPHAKGVRHDVGVGQGPLHHRQRLVRRATQPAGQGPIVRQMAIGS